MDKNLTIVDLNNAFCLMRGASRKELIGRNLIDMVSENRFEELKGPGLALGVEKDYEYSSKQRSHLKKGQVIIVGTDGIWEGHNRAGMMFGKQRLQKLIRAYAFSSAETIVNAIFNEHRNFTQNAKKEDDITMVIIKIT